MTWTPTIYIVEEINIGFSDIIELYFVEIIKLSFD